MELQLLFQDDVPGDSDQSADNAPVTLIVSTRFSLYAPSAYDNNHGLYGMKGTESVRKIF